MKRVVVLIMSVVVVILLISTKGLTTSTRDHVPSTKVLCTKGPCTKVLCIKRDGTTGQVFLFRPPWVSLL